MVTCPFTYIGRLEAMNEVWTREVVAYIKQLEKENIALEKQKADAIDLLKKGVTHDA